MAQWPRCREVPREPPSGSSHVCTNNVHTRTQTFPALPSGLSSLLSLNVSAGRSRAHSYRTRFDYVLILSRKAERASLIFETQNNAYWAEKNMADSWTRLSPEGNIISVTEHVYGSHLDLLPSLLNGKNLSALVFTGNSKSLLFCEIVSNSRSLATDNK